jgi:hypothetical protein
VHKNSLADPASRYREIATFVATSAAELKELEMSRLRAPALRFAVLTSFSDEQWDRVFHLSRNGVDLDTLFDKLAEDMFNGQHA